MSEPHRLPDRPRTKQDVLMEINFHASYFAGCREIGQGINSKDTVRMSRLICEAVDLGATQQEVFTEFENNGEDPEFNWELAHRTRHLVMP